METIVTKSQVADAVYAAIPRLACELPADIEAGLAAALAREDSPRGRAVLEQLVENAAVAREDRVPLCQDTGTVWVSLEIGPGVLVAGDVFAEVNAAVARAYDEARLRMSVVRDAILDRANTNDNTPAFCDLHPVDELGAARLHVMLKGGGSDNASRVAMLVPGAGKQGIVDELMRCVREKGANACPPLVVGVGIGGTFDKVAGLAKRALMRPVDQPAADPRVRALEEELLAAVNATGVGPGGLGGATTALAVRVATAPCHIAALPLAINMGCSAMRRCTIDLAAERGAR
ncbi:fumarate hydratase [Arabiibacter massiliensis]|uniref:fumarate hydratase n=1 Tax=Arabiibacter massiliensis TaxID=1870985 RepID=UPI0009BA9B91|nr:fumarate hydratase [Arabiibacter massiliensis]